MAIRLAINGFGRIGRLVLRAIIESDRRDVEVVGINDLGPVETNAHLLRYDTVHGPLNREVKTKDGGIDAGRGWIKVTAERDPAKLPWKELNVDVALECTGIFTKRDDAAKHLQAGAKRVLISAPATAPTSRSSLASITISCRTATRSSPTPPARRTAWSPVAAIMHKAIGIEQGYMTTIHSYTGDQPVLDTLHKDLYRARAAALSMIPTTTGAAKAVGEVLPELKGKLDGSSIRVPTPNVSMIDFKFVPKRATTVDEVNKIAIEAATGSNSPLKGILAVNDQPLVSSDFNHNPASSTFRSEADAGDRGQAGARAVLVRQ